MQQDNHLTIFLGCQRKKNNSKKNIFWGKTRAGMKFATFFFLGGLTVTYLHENNTNK